MVHQYNVDFQEKMKKKNQEKEIITTFSRENVRENNKKCIENNKRKKVKSKKYSNKQKIIQFMLRNK